MKWLVLLLSIELLYSAPIDKTIDELLEKNERSELQVPKYDPFKRATPLLQKKSRKSTSKALPVELSAIMNNKGFFNGRWYKKGDKTPEGRVIKITNSSVYLRQGKKTKILRLHNQKRLFKIREKEAE